MKWIGVNTEYISLAPETITDSAGQPTVTSKPVGVSVVGDVDPSGVPTADFGVVLSPAFLDAVAGIAGTECGGGAKRASKSPL